MASDLDDGDGISEPREKRPRLESSFQLADVQDSQGETSNNCLEAGCPSPRLSKRPTLMIEVLDSPRPNPRRGIAKGAICVDDSEAEDECSPHDRIATFTPRAPQQRRQHALRISASRVAAAAGLHPFTDVVDLFLEMLYQDLPELLLQDAALVGVELVSPIAERARLLDKSGQTQALEAAIQQATLDPSVDGARLGHEAVRKAIVAAEGHGKLTAEEAADLKETLQREISMNFGSQHEDAAIRAYEAHVGCPVYGQQRRIAVPLPRERAKALSQAFPPNAQSGKIDSTKETAVENDCLRQSSEPAFFWLTGFVDGMVDIQVETVVVEVKHRIGRIKHPPDISDIIQLGSYCRALGCAHGDLVQVLRESSRAVRNESGNLRRAQSFPGNLSAVDKQDVLTRSQSLPCMELSETAFSDGTLHVTRVDFTEGSRDRRGWDEHVLPALYNFATAVYAARKDDGLRYRLLASDPKSRTLLVEELCPHLAR